MLRTSLRALAIHAMGLKRIKKVRNNNPNKAWVTRMK